MLLVGGGYDTGQDTTLYSSDSIGRGIYMLDAETGARIRDCSRFRLRLGFTGHVNLPYRLDVVDHHSFRLVLGDLAGQAGLIAVGSYGAYALGANNVANVASLFLGEEVATRWLVEPRSSDDRSQGAGCGRGRRANSENSRTSLRRPSTSSWTISSQSASGHDPEPATARRRTPRAAPVIFGFRHH